MKKTILLLFYREISALPPLMTMIDVLCKNFSLKIICCEKPGQHVLLKQQYEKKDVQFLSNVDQHDLHTRYTSLLRRFGIAHEVSRSFFKETKIILETTKYDLLWVIHEQTAFEFRELLQHKKFFLSFYELNDHRREFLDKIKPIVQCAEEVFVPEYNRACILRVWLQLKHTPIVIPNKPLRHPRQRNIPNIYSEQLEGKKIVLYQGFIQRSRNLDMICEAVKDMPGYCVVLMGKGDDSYLNELKSKYPQILHIPFIAPPEHLYVTSWARVAIVKYDFVLLNAIFCAPNKTWEYTGFGIPVLGHAIPGLQYTIGQYKAGICIDLDNVECIKSAITEIDEHYDEFSKNAHTFYESYDIKKSLNDIVSQHIQ